MPYEIGTLYDNPHTALDENSEAVVPSVQMWEMLMHSSWVCGTLQGVEGWFVMNNERESPVWTIFLPFTTEPSEYDGSLSGNYWTSTSFHPADSGAGVMFTNYFCCHNTPNLLQHQHATGYYMPTNGKYKFPIRTLKILD